MVDILLDSGCLRTIIRRDLLPEDYILNHEDTLHIRCAHGDVTSYPTAWIDLEINEKHYNIKAGVSNTLPRPILLDHDISDLCDLITNYRPLTKLKPF